MKKIISALTMCLNVLISQAQISYTIDSTAFNALNLEGGMAEVEFADINQGGHLDILTVGDHGSPFINTNQHGISVFFGNGTGTGWTLFQNGNFGYGGIAIGDVNNDRYLDVAYGIHHDYSATDFGDQLIEAAVGDGTGMNWVPWDDSLATAGETYGMFGTDLGDVNNDGWLDIGSGSFGCCAGTHIYLNQADGTWQHSFGYINGNTSHYFQFGDLNHDGNLDFVCCHQNGAAYFGDGTGNFILKQNNLPPTGNLGYFDVSLGDVDNDGDEDFAFLQGNKPYVYKWNEPTQQWINLSAGLPATGTYFVVKLADLDMDGYLDLIAERTGVLEIWKGNGGISWTNILNFAVPNLDDCKDINIDDADHNGYPDILMWAEYYISIFNYDNRLYLFKENSIATALNITMTYPKNYECFPNDAVRFIKWICAIPQNHASSVKIEFSSTGNAGPWTVVEAAVPNNGKYQWTVPQGVLSTDCYLRLTALDSITLNADTAINSNPFQVGICNPALFINESYSGTQLSASPNPFRDKTVIYSDLKNCTLTIFDITGKIIFKNGRVTFPYSINRNNLSAGMYVAEFTSEGKEPLRLKLLAE